MQGARALFPEMEDGAASASDAQTAMLLLRASTLHMLRLQLAMERRDRAVALQSVDELVALEARMASLLETAPLDPLLRRLDEQKNALMREKFGLAAGLARRPAEPIIWPAQNPGSGPPAAPDPAAASDWDELPFEPSEAFREERRARWPAFLAAALLLLLAAVAGAALALGWLPDTLSVQFMQGETR